MLAAAQFLAKQSYVDANRIYLGGHSTGGTLVLLVAESSERFRAVFSFGPAADVRGYPAEFVPFDTSNSRESELRSPIYWLASIKSPVFVIEGTGGNHDSLQEMARASANPQAHFLAVKGADHFEVLAPVCALLADKILRDSNPASGISLTDQELNEAFARSR
ncbi:MAG: alpha/beta hydrolase family protein [Candidatus Saccharimonadales bacterium]